MALAAAEAQRAVEARRVQRLRRKLDEAAGKAAAAAYLVLAVEGARLQAVADGEQAAAQAGREKLPGQQGGTWLSWTLWWKR